jgi:putative glutathione S-transferase
VVALFDELDHLEALLGRQPWLCGDRITEADWRLFPTLLRFDPVYHHHFKCSRRRLRDYPNLWNHTRALYQVPGIRETVNLPETRMHYFASHETINPHRIVPIAPELDLDGPHDRPAWDA